MPSPGSSHAMDGFVQTQLLALSNKIKTGDPTVDMMLAGFLPFVVGQVGTAVIQTIKGLVFSQGEKPPKKMHQRTIVHQATQNGLAADADNKCLIKAIQLFVDANCTIKGHTAGIDLMTMVSKKKKKSRTSVLVGSTASSRLDSFKIVERPEKGVFHKLGKFDNYVVEACFQESTSNTNAQTQNSDNKQGSDYCSVTLRSSSKESIASFVQTSFDWYKKQLVLEENKDRFFFDLRDVYETALFTRYTLGSGKTFDTLFSTQCQELKAMVDRFQAKKGRYAIEGFPHKMGILLSGLPGTGKTSLIKAMSQYLHRHIVNIRLSRIATNEDLMKVLFNKKFLVDDSGIPIDLEFNQLIFVLEDVDADSPVVKNRALVESNEQAPVGNEQAGHRPRSSDALNLTGLLNALDGVVETPGCIVIMTTNHPERLDPALTRPGRFDKKIAMGYMILEDMVAMINHFYDTRLSKEEKDALQTLLQDQGLAITAAELEAATSEADTVEQLLAVLRDTQCSHCLNEKKRSSEGDDDIGLSKRPKISETESA